MDLALYDSEFGYYARAPRRSGRAGDFFTSVDVGALFGELIEIQLAEMQRLLQTPDVARPTFDFVEAGAGNGRLSTDILRAARRRDSAFYETIRPHLVDASAEARRAQAETLGDVGDRLVSSATLPESFEGALLANELLDAFPVHQVVMREDGLHEVYVDSATGSDGCLTPVQNPALGSDTRLTPVENLTTDDWRLTTVEGPLSTSALVEYLDRLGVTLEPGWRVEINLRAVDWIREAARRLRRGFIILIDYGHDARELYSPTHAAGTLTTYSAHRSAGPESPASTPSWLQRPGDQDITSHVDFTSIRAAAEASGLTTIGFLDQTYFLLGLINNPATERPFDDLKDRLALKTLVMPGGLGSTHKVLILGKGVGTPSLRGCSFRIRVT